MQSVVDEIEITDIGPIGHLTIPLPDGGGVIVLRARNDAGKSEALKAVDALVTGKGSIEKRDGSARGQISLGEARLTVVKQQRRDGAELAAVSLDSKFDLADLVDPGLKDPEKADGFRIKALVQLAGVDPDITLFHALAEDKREFDEIVRPEAGECEDVVTMAATVKRDFEAAARKAHDLSENHLGAALGHREAALGYDEAIESNEEKLQALLEDAIREEQRLTDADKAANEANEEAEKARVEIEAAGRDSSLPSIELATKAAADCAARVHEVDDEIKLLEDSLKEARAKKRDLESALKSADETLKACNDRERMLAKWREQLGKAIPVVDAALLSKAREAVTAARKAVEEGALQRDKATRMAKADTADRMAQTARRKAERLREAAKGTEEILSSLVGKCGTALRVERGRLVTNHDRGTIPYSELSDGTRWKIAIDIGIEALARQGVPTHKMILIIPQVAWSELSPSNRKLIHEHARERGVHILTALATDDESVLAEPFAA